MNGRKIAILGMGISALERKYSMRELVSGYEVWSCNNAYNFYRGHVDKFDRFFELHLWEYLKGWKSGSECHYTELERLGCPVYVTQHIPIVTRQEKYPYLNLFEHFHTNYFLGSPPLMLALAIYEHDMGNVVDEIQTYGFDHQDGRHAQQRHAWAFWISKAIERGIMLTGTATGFYAEPENDEGLQGVREHFGRLLVDKKANSEDERI